MSAQHLGTIQTGGVKPSNGTGSMAKTAGSPAPLVPRLRSATAGHPDADLLALCAQLADMQAEWQRLYDATSDEPDLVTDADREWSHYSNRVWPGVEISTWNDRPLHPYDVPGRLRFLRATTVAGKAAKAAAIIALDEAAAYTDCRDDYCQLAASLMQDVAGIKSHYLGEDAPTQSKEIQP